jgi:outer membrane receptor for monomeric catechols
MTHLTDTITASLNAGYKTRYTTIPANRNAALIRKISPYWRLDARLVYSPNPNIEVALVGQNLLMPRHKEFSDFDQLEVPRTYYGSVAVRF